MFHTTSVRLGGVDGDWIVRQITEFGIRFPNPFGRHTRLLIRFLRYILNQRKIERVATSHSLLMMAPFDSSAASQTKKEEGGIEGRLSDCEKEKLGLILRRFERSQ